MIRLRNLLGMSLLVAMCFWSGRATKPNILFMMADQMRFDAFLAGATSHQPPVTKSWSPELDALASDATMFKYAYSSTPTCTPARAAILTGQKPWNHGMLGYGRIADRYKVELPRLLDAAGYRTVAIGKDHFMYNTSAPDFEPYRHGYNQTNLYDGIVSEDDDYHSWFRRLKDGEAPEKGWPSLDMNSWRGRPYAFDEKFHPTYYVGAAAVRYLRETDNSSSMVPFFLKVSFHRPHSPYDPPSRFLDAVKVEGLPPVLVSQDGWDARFKTDPACGPKYADAWCGSMPSTELQLARRAYRASISFVDAQIGKILTTLRQRNLYDRTLILFTADHGDGQGDHFHWRKGYPYEFSAHVPMILRWPTRYRGISSPPKVVTSVVELRDLLPTFADVANATHLIPTGHPIDGATLRCLLKASPDCPQWRQYIDMEHATCYNITNHWNGLTDGSTTKYIFNALDGSEQLFDLKHDPYELRNVAAYTEYADVIRTWRARLVQQFEDEQRGPSWVRDGKLLKRPQTQLYSPNYPNSTR